MECSPNLGVFGSREVGLLSDIIRAAYTDTLSTDTWTEILEMIGQVMPYDAAGAVFANVQTGRLENRITPGVDADLLRWYDTHFPAIAMIADVAQSRRLAVWRPSNVVGKEEYGASELREDLATHFELGEPICMSCGSPPQITARFWFLRKNSKGDFTDREVSILRLVQPHFCAALAIAKALLEGSAYRVAFQYAMRPVFICDAAGKVVDLNVKAQQFVTDAGGDSNYRLAEIEAMVQHMISDQADNVSAELLGQKCQVNLSAVAAPNVPTSYLLAIISPEQLRQALYSFMCESGLSDREVEICAMVARGMRNREIADALFIAESTVKDHVSNIFEKLGIESRSSIAPKLLGF